MADTPIDSPPVVPPVLPEKLAIAVAKANVPPPPAAVAREGTGHLPEPPKAPFTGLTSGQILEREKEKFNLRAEIDRLHGRLDALA